MYESLAALVLSFLTSFVFLRFWIPAAKRFGLVGKDINKYDRPEVAEAGGVSVVLGVAVGLFTYLFLKAFWGTETHLPEIYATISAVVLSGMIGFTDDILGWKKGIPQWVKPLLTTILALPFATLALLYPEYNSFEVFGIPVWFYALILVPIGVVGASNALNMLAGYNGLEAGLSLILLATIGAKAYVLGNLWIAYMAFIGLASLFAFLYYNWYPAKVFPGDTLPYAMGTYIAALAILGNLEVFAVAIFPLFFLDFFLYLYARFVDRAGDVQAFGVPQPDGTIERPYEKLYDTCHIAIALQKKLRGYATERGVTVTILLAQFVISVIVFLLL